MKKFYLIALDKDRPTLPERLRKLGVAHIEELQGRGETYQSLEREKAETESAYYFLQNYVDKKKRVAATELSQGSWTVKEIRDIVATVSELKRELDSTHEQATQLVREIDRTMSWGDISAEVFAKTLEGASFSVRLFDVPSKELSNIPKDLAYIKILAPKGSSRIAIILDQDEMLPDLPPSFHEFLPPEHSLSQMRRELDSIEKRKKQILESLKEKSESLSLLKAYLHQVESEIILEKLRSGMPEHERFSYVKGYVPARE
jgi:V/A-type H+-transporting ATPase subunit I